MQRPRFFFPLWLITILFSTVALYGEHDITLDQLYRWYTFYPNEVDDIVPLNDGQHYSVLENGRNIVSYSYVTGKMNELIFSADSVDSSDIPVITGYSFNKDESRILISTAKEHIYRYSFRSDYYVYDRKTGKIFPVFLGGKQQLAALSPDGKNVAFVFDNNLYIKDIDSGKLTHVTTDGKQKEILNGLPDWVYEEEFTLKTGYYWSPDSRKIAFYRFDESRVKDYDLIFYTNLYPEIYSYKYPLAGGENSIVSIKVFNLDSSRTTTMDVGEETDQYIPRIKWLPGSKRLCVTRLNRRQNHADLLICNTSTGKSVNFHTEKDKRFLSQFTNNFVTFIDSGKSAIIMSDKDGFMHLYRYTTGGKFVNQITKGNWEVTDLLGVDDKRKEIYYQSTEESPLERQIYVINYDGTNKRKISNKKGTNTATFSADFSYCVIDHSEAGSPDDYGVYDRKGKLVRMIEDNAGVKKLLAIYHLPKLEFFQFPNKDGTMLNAYRILPTGFKKDKKYPMLVYVYGGPESQMVTDEWRYRSLWFDMLAQKGYIVVCADNRGTAGRGVDFEKSTYLQLGKLETEDQISLAKYMIKQGYVDSSRIGVFGWSYGGYMTLLCLTKGNRIFKMGIAVAPVTNWRYYDTIYTERYMRKPSENPEGYDDNSPINFVDSLKGKLLLIHGMADDNVHLQNSTELIKKLVAANKQFDMQFYPDKNHGIYGGNTTYHLYSRMTDYIMNNL